MLGAVGAAARGGGGAVLVGGGTRRVMGFHHRCYKKVQTYLPSALLSLIQSFVVVLEEEREKGWSRAWRRQ